jgi:ABC-type proline/glycine betaine transport system ATPase subunit
MDEAFSDQDPLIRTEMKSKLLDMPEDEREVYCKEVGL